MSYIHAQRKISQWEGKIEYVQQGVWGEVKDNINIKKYGWWNMWFWEIFGSEKDSFSFFLDPRNGGKFEKTLIETPTSFYCFVWNVPQRGTIPRLTQELGSHVFWPLSFLASAFFKFTDGLYSKSLNFTYISTWRCLYPTLVEKLAWGMSQHVHQTLLPHLPLRLYLSLSIISLLLTPSSVLSLPITDIPLHLYVLRGRRRVTEVRPQM